MCSADWHPFLLLCLKNKENEGKLNNKQQQTTSLLFGAKPAMHHAHMTVEELESGLHPSY